MHGKIKKNWLVNLVNFFLFTLLCVQMIFAEQVAVRPVARSNDSSGAVIPIMVDFRLNPSQIVVGQESLGECVVTYDPRRVSVRGLEVPQFGTALFSETLQGPSREQVEVQGVMMVRLVWSARIYPREAGTMRLPGVIVGYGVAQEQRHAGFFSWAFSREQELHRIKSEDALLEVQPLPASKESINVVGQYTECQVSIDRAEIGQGEAVALTIKLFGSGNAGFEQNITPVLPDGCMWHHDGYLRTPVGAQFAFVVQCRQAGVVTIPEQRVQCYDPLTRKKYTIVSRALTVTVTQRAASPTSVVNDVSGGTSEDEEEDPIVAPIADTKISLVRKMQIPRMMFLMLCLLILGVMAGWSHRLVVVVVVMYLAKMVGCFCARQRLYWCFWRGRLCARDVYLFFMRYAETGSQHEGWRTFWIEVQSDYFGGAPDRIFSRTEGDRALFWVKRMTCRVPWRRHAALCVVLVLTSTCVLAGDVSVGQQIKDIRAAQYYASYGMYEKLEQQIRDVRGTDESCMRYTPWMAFICRLSHLLPLICWQLFFLCALFLLYRRRTRVAGLLSVLVLGLIMWVVAYERSDAWHYVLIEVPLYLGPGSGYPIRRGLVPGNEVRLIRRASENGAVWLLVNACGEKGWLPHDAVV